MDDLQKLPIIDWELGMKLAGNKQDLAEDMLKLMINALPDELTSIKKLYEDKNYSSLLESVHKLHGAICYVGLPRIKTILFHLERDLKNNIMDSLPSLVNQFDTEVSLLLQYYSRHH